MKENENVGEAIFTGGAFIGRCWLLCSSGTWPLGKLAISEVGISLSLPWKKVTLKWDEVSNVKVKYGISVYIYHDVPRLNPYLVFTTKRSDRTKISDALELHGYHVNFGC